MAKSDLIEYTSQAAYDLLKKGNDEVLRGISLIEDFNKKALGAKTPSGSDSAIKALNDQLTAQDKLIKKLQDDYQKLADIKNKTVSDSSNNEPIKERIKLLQSEIVNRSNSRRETQLQYKANTDLWGAYSKLNAQTAIAARNLQDLIARGRLMEQTQKQWNAEVRNAHAAFNALQTRVLSADRAVGRWQRTSERSIALGRDLVNAFGVATGVALFAQLSRDIFNTTAQLQSMDLALKQVIGSEQEAAETQAFLSQIAENYGVNILTLTKSYTGFFAASKNAIESGKISAQQIRDIFQSVAKAAGAMGLSVDQQEGAFLALSQMISKGNVQAEELRGQLSERLPGAFGILAKSMGVTEMELNKLLKDGKVLAAEVLPAFAKELERAYGVENLQRVETLNASTTRLKNTWIDFIRTINEGDGVFTKTLSFLVDSLANILKGYDLLFKSNKQLQEETETSLFTQSREEELDFLNRIQVGWVKASQARERYNLFNAQVEGPNGFREQRQKLQEELKWYEKELKNVSFVGALLGAADVPQNKIDQIRKKINELNNSIKVYEGRQQAASEVLEGFNQKTETSTALTDKQVKAIKDLNKALDDLRDKLSKSTSDREIADLERRKFLIEQTLDSEKLYLEQRIKGYSEIRDLDREIAAKRYLETVRATTDQIEEQRRALKVQVYESALSESEKRKRINEINIQYDAILKNELQIAADRFRTDQEKAEADSDKRITDDKKKNFQEFLDYRKKYGRPTGDEEKFGDANFAPSDEMDQMLSDWDAYIDKKKQSKKATDDEKASFQDYANVALQTLALISQALEMQTNRRLEALEKEKNVQIKFAGDSAEAREAIEQEFNEQKIKIQREAAKKQKAIAIFEAIINTASAVVEALPNVVLAAITGALGAAQIALIASQPLPGYWKGRDGGKPEWAWTQERGRELVLDKNNRIKSFGSEKGAQKTWLDAGDKVKTASETSKILSEYTAFNQDFNSILQSNSISSTPMLQVNGGMTERQFDKVLSKNLKDRPIQQINIDKNGFSVALIKKSGRINYINNVVSGKADSV